MSADGREQLVAANNVNSAADFSGHAEIVALRRAQELWGRTGLRGATLYASGEPCAMCAGALFWAGIKRVVFGATQADVIRLLGPSPAMPTDSRRTLAWAIRTMVMAIPSSRSSPPASPSGSNPGTCAWGWP